MSEEKKLGGEAMKKRGHSIGKIDENYNKTDKALLPKSNEVRRVAKMTRKSLAYALEGRTIIRLIRLCYLKAMRLEELLR